jgi:cysteine synthase B
MGLLDAIGNTPLVELHHLAPHEGVRLFAKLEGQNPSGSVKDRIALAMVDAAEKQGEIRPGDTLVEASTGNTAIALAMVARQKGYELKVVLPEGVVPVIEDVLTLYGVEFIESEPKAGMLGAIETARTLSATRGWYAVRQFENPANLEVHARTTGEEIARALPEVDVLVAGIGTGGTIMGVGQRLRRQNPALRVIGVEPRLGERLQGLRNLDEGYRPPLLNLDLLNGRFQVASDQALAAAHRIIRTEGIMAGVSSGATLVAALRVAEQVKRGTFVLMFSDGGWKYLPTRPWDAALAGSRLLDETHWW